MEESVTQPIPPPPPPPPPVDRETVKLFLEQKPPVFDGMGEPAQAESWIRALERIFAILGCNDRERMKTMPRDQAAGMTWEGFKTEIYNKYVPKSYRKAKASEFYNLTQGRMTVTEYDRALNNMTRYAPDQVDTDEKLAEKFREGLRHEIRMSLASRGRLPYAEATPPSALIVGETATSLESVRARMWEWGRDRTLKDPASSQGHCKLNQGEIAINLRDNSNLTAQDSLPRLEHMP
ncbi:uncharacterized protein LOC121808995 [Salvia splendens]|uniref:uncharacterized protein LOC121757677 n=1 Tax=Salvia splendens TaxID=180675 RepID=UPI001C263A51|nr:uncharacterized protein LOC121757677 [Salvia splendens]XP_042035109.1 uncharacterized protein LOC121781416 [Salvia splendens]XP_042065435.1 uncharacterized protein LOC121808946 [Salvia splendens]XP_042065481.1 uncharacterized protein LOC121808995 [Salvia splendens]